MILPQWALPFVLGMIVGSVVGKAEILTDK